MEFNIVADMFTIVFFLCDFGIVGMAVIHWKGPLILQQFYLIFVYLQQLSLRTKTQLISDSFSFAQATRLDADIPLDLVKFLSNE